MTTVIVGERTAGESAKVRKRLESLIKTINTSTFDVAELLSDVKHNGHYQPHHNTFQEYLETLEIKPRKAQYLVKIVDVMKAVGISREKYEPVGINKLREIASLDPEGTWVNPKTNTPESLKDWIKHLVEDGQEMPVNEIRQHVRTLKGLVGENDLVWINVCVKRAVKENNVSPAFELVRRNLGSKGKDDEGMATEYSDGACLEVLCTEYLNDPANSVLPEKEK